MDISREQWARIKSVFDTAMSLPRADRASYLAANLADDQPLLEYARELLPQYDVATRICADSRASDSAKELQTQDHLTAGTLVAHFRIVRRIGEGGMGVVYLAEDQRLPRLVALKFMVPRIRTLFKDARHQLMTESRAHAALDHPQIVTLLDVLEWQGDIVLVMQYVEGQSLSERIAREPLPFGFAVRTVMQIAEAVAYAHSRGIVHCDLKPANIHLLQHGDVKILDFGLARAVRPDGGTDGELSEFGTPEYLAPERLVGSTATASSDVFALGVLLYEVLTAVSPFHHADPLDRLTRDPEPPSVHVNSIPKEIDALVMRCLSRHPRQRLQAHELSRALNDALARFEGSERLPSSGVAMTAEAAGENAGKGFLRGEDQWLRRSLVGGAIMAVLIILMVGFVWPIGRLSESTPRSRRIAVLPFENDAGLPEWEADAVSNDMLNALAIVPGTSVTPWSSVSAYARSTQPIDEIASFLSVEWVVKGRIRASPPDLIVSIAVFNRAGGQVWEREFSSRASTLMTLPADVLRAIPTELGLAPTRGPVVTHTPVPEARAAWAQARHLMRSTGTEDFNRAQGLLEEAIRLDPDYAQAYVSLARHVMQLENSGGISRDGARSRAAVALERAAQLDNTLAELYLAIGTLRFEYEWDWDNAGRAFRLAIQLNPSDPEALVEYASYLAARGDLVEAIKQVRSAQDLDPGSPHRGDVAFMLYFAGRYDESIALYVERIDNEPNESLRRYSLARAYSAAGRYDEAVAELRRVQELVGGLGQVPVFDAELARVYATRQAPEARAIVRSLEGRLSDAQPNLFAQVAYVHAALGDKDRAFGYLRNAGRLRAKSLIWAKVDPRLDPLRTDSRYQEFVKDLGLPQ